MMIDFILLFEQILAWAHTNNDYNIHMYCFDPRQITEKTYKCDLIKCDKYRLKFLIETIDNLNQSLINKGRYEYELVLNMYLIFYFIAVF
jgi:hypothetical protein